MKNVCPAGLLLIGTEACWLPSGFRILAYALGLVTPVTYITTCWLAVVVVNVSRTSCPTAVGPTLTAEPSIAIVPVMSGGTLFSCTVSAPAFVEVCWIHIVYVPTVTRVWVSRKKTLPAGLLL